MSQNRRDLQKICLNVHYRIFQCFLKCYFYLIPHIKNQYSKIIVVSKSQGGRQLQGNSIFQLKQGTNSHKLVDTVTRSTRSASAQVRKPPA